MEDVHNITNVSAKLDNIVVDIKANVSDITVKGEKGDKGDDGFSPIVSMSKEGDTTTLNITDKEGTKTSLIKDGEKGDKGDDGEKGDKGDDGFSPIVSMSKEGDTTTLNITDKEGTKTSLIKDGEKGDKGDDGEKGDKGDDYILTEADKEEIASKVDLRGTIYTNNINPEKKSFINVNEDLYTKGIKPISDNTMNLGSESYRWQKLCVNEGKIDNLNVSGGATITGEVSTESDVYVGGGVYTNLLDTYSGSYVQTCPLLTETVIPLINNTYILGSSKQRWKTIYGNNGNFTNLTVTGKLSAADSDICKVNDVKVDGTSVVTDKVANIDLSTKTEYYINYDETVDYISGSIVLKDNNYYIVVKQVEYLNKAPESFEQMPDLNGDGKVDGIDLSIFRTCTETNVYKTLPITFNVWYVYQPFDLYLRVSNKLIPLTHKKLSEFTDDLGNSPTHTHKQYLELNTNNELILSKDDSYIGTDYNEAGYVTPAIGFEKADIVLYPDSTGDVKIWNYTDECSYKIATEDYVGTSIKQYAPYFAPYYDATKTYSVGDIVLNEVSSRGIDKAVYLLKCKTAITKPESFDLTKWTIIRDLGSTLFSIDKRTSDMYSIVELTDIFTNADILHRIITVYDLSFGQYATILLNSHESSKIVTTGIIYQWCEGWRVVNEEVEIEGLTWNDILELFEEHSTPFCDFATKQDIEPCNYNMIVESDVTVTTDSTKGVAPYSTSYGYTNITINNSNIHAVEGAIYSFIVDTKMVVGSGNRNVRVRFGEDGDWIPVMGYATSILSGNTYFIKNMTVVFQYKSTIISGGAFHILYDANSTYILNYLYDADRYICSSIIHRYELCGFDENGNIMGLYTNSTNNANNKKTPQTKGFILRPFEYYSFTTQYSEGSIFSTSSNLCKIKTSIDLRYIIQYSSTFDINTPIYLKFTQGDDGLYYLPQATTETPYPVYHATELPTVNDGYVYWYLGRAIKDGGYECYLGDKQSIFKWNETKSKYTICNLA